MSALPFLYIIILSLYLSSDVHVPAIIFFRLLKSIMYGKGYK
jgi:hypothetical protein